MKRVTGIGGIFIRANDPESLRSWYQKHLGIDVQDWGGTVFSWADPDDKTVSGSTTWSVGDGAYFKPGNASFMVNYRVDDLMALLDVLKSEGCEVMDNTDISDYGKFGWVIDPEGNKVELWEPPPGM
ncbi:MAG: glyoxalase [Oceanospirillaceae bacterium]|nr:glyoxalase [Oceanospirillaceae bacterium]|tara:strand:+ start:2272 stop:2652 length:381 start_codon:yes stop_codon:yes gene_type:complete